MLGQPPTDSEYNALAGTVDSGSRGVHISAHGPFLLVGFSKQGALHPVLPCGFQRRGHCLPLSFTADAAKSKPPDVRVVVDPLIVEPLSNVI